MANQSDEADLMAMAGRALEPVALTLGETLMESNPKRFGPDQMHTLSAAISLKRIADALEPIAECAKMLARPLFVVNAGGGSVEMEQFGLAGDIHTIATVLRSLLDAGQLASKPMSRPIKTEEEAARVGGIKPPAQL